MGCPWTPAPARFPGIALAFSGYRGSGKTTLSRLSSAYLSCGVVSFGDSVRKIADTRGLSHDLATLQEIGSEQAMGHAREFCIDVLSQAPGWNPGSNIVIDGVRHRVIRDVLRALVAPTILLNVFIDPTDELRQERLRVRNDPFPKLYTNNPNEQELQDLKKTADVVVTNSDSLDEIVAFIQSIPRV
jgi:cytidylate kinase